MEMWQLQQMQSLPLEVKAQKSKLRIREWYEHFDGMVYVSFSGGKDSTVLLHLVRSMYPDVPAVFCNTGLEYPEIVKFVNEFENIEKLKPKLTFKEVIEKHGWPVISKETSKGIYQIQNSKSEKLINKRLYGEGIAKVGIVAGKHKHLLNAPFKCSDRCCDVMKKQPFARYGTKTKRKPYIGTNSEESKLRTQSWLKFGCNAFEHSKPQSRPLSFWTEQDVLQYIKQNKLQIAKVYGELIETADKGLSLTGAKRTGCMFCMFGVHLETGENRFQRMRRTHPKLWEYCMFKLGAAEVLEYIGVDYGQQTSMFE